MELIFFFAILIPALVFGNNAPAVDSNAFFSRHLLASIQNEGNMVCSPLSAQMSLGLLNLGAAGRTKEQISRGLGLNPGQDDVNNNVFRDLQNSLMEEAQRSNATIRIANKIYASHNLQISPNFQRNAREVFKASAETVDFENSSVTARIINTWVEEATNGKIQNLVQPDQFNADTQLVMVNALYFKNLWKSAFDPHDTRNRTFHLSPNSQVDIPFMFKEGDFSVGYYPQLNASMLILPYQGDKMSLVILRPNKITGLPALERALRTQSLSSLIGRTHVVNDMEILIPKFTMEVTLNLKEPLEKMGMTDMFTTDADLSGIVTRRRNEIPLSVNKVIQKTFIEITEQGTEAASATYGQIHVMSLPPRFEVNRPFLFYIVQQEHHEGPVVLFTGRYVTPP